MMNLVRADRLIQVTEVDTFDGQVLNLTSVMAGNFSHYFAFIDLSTNSEVVQRLHNGRVISTSIIHLALSLSQKLASFLIQIEITISSILGRLAIENNARR
jgi:hypothetical protein